MKVFQIFDGICYHYHPEYKTAKEASQYFVPEFLFMDAPDYVFEGWGFDPDAEGDDRFICPPLEYTDEQGNVWLYDGGVGIEGTGTYYLKDGLKPSEQPSYEELYTLAKAVERGMSE